MGFHPADPGSNPGTSTLPKKCLAVSLLGFTFSRNERGFKRVFHFGNQELLGEFLPSYS